MKGIPVESDKPEETPDHKPVDSAQNYPGKVPNPFVTTITHSVLYFVNLICYHYILNEFYSGVFIFIYFMIFLGFVYYLY
jgi:hypothetical protein